MKIKNGFSDFSNTKIWILATVAHVAQKTGDCHESRAGRVLSSYAKE